MDIIREAKKKYNVLTQSHREAFDEMQNTFRSTPEGKKYFSETADIWLKANTGKINADEAEKKAEKLYGETVAFMEKQGYNAPSFEYEPLCKLCGDTGYSAGKMCGCLKKLVVAECRNASNLSVNMKNESFDTYDEKLFSGDNRKQAENVRLQCLAFCKNFDKRCDNLLFSGKTGSGKTYFANCIANRLLYEGYTVLYKTAFALMDDITQYTLGQQERSVYDFIFSCDLLIIDDLGTERLTDFTEMQLYNILQERMNKQKPIIITTNLTIAEMKNSYGERILSRIAGGFTGIHTQEEDLRLKKKLMNK